MIQKSTEPTTKRLARDGERVQCKPQAPSPKTRHGCHQKSKYMPHIYTWANSHTRFLRWGDNTQKQLFIKLSDGAGAGTPRLKIVVLEWRGGADRCGTQTRPWDEPCGGEPCGEPASWRVNFYDVVDVAYWAHEKNPPSIAWKLG